MKVHELIKLLQSMNQESDVVIPIRDEQGPEEWFVVEDIYYDEKFDEVQLDWK